MAETWVGIPAVYGSFNRSNGVWFSRAEAEVTNAPREGYAAWENVPVDDPDLITSATLHLERGSGGAALAALAFYTGGVPAAQSRVPYMSHPLGATFATVARLDAPESVDVTEAVKAATASNWSYGDTLGLLFEHEFSQGGWTATLEIVLEEPTQEVAPVTVSIPITVGAVGFEASVRPATVSVPVSVGAVDIIAPRSVTPATVTVPVTVGATVTHGTGPGPSLDQASTIGVPITVGVPALVVSVKPPPPAPPWERLAALPEYQQALTARHATIDSRVEVIDENDVVIATFGGDNATHAGMISGSVQVNSNNPVWWEATLQVDQAEIAPTTVGDLFHPLSHNRIRVWWRILIDPDTGQWAEIPVGTVYPDWPDVTDDGDAEVSITIRGQDAAYLISQAKMDNSVTVGGERGDEAIRQILTTAAPWAPLSLDKTDRRLPAEYEAGEPGADPWEVCREIATSTGMLLHVDRMGIIRLVKKPATGAPPVAEFVEGPNMAVTAATTSVPIGRVRNKIVVHATATQDADGNEIEPFSVTATVDDETHPLWVGHGHLYVEHINTDQVIDRDQAQDMAEGILSGRVSLAEEGRIVFFPHPHIDPLDNIAISADRVGMSGVRQIVAWSLTLGDLGGMEGALTGRREW